MTRGDILRMAREAALPLFEDDAIVGPLQRFAALVAAAEREACAKVCDELGDEFADANAADCAEAIRSRGEK